MFLRALKYLLLPPAINILLILLALFALRRSPRLQKLTLASSLLSLWLFSTPLVAVTLADLLQNRYPTITAETILQAEFDAVVILGGGRNYRAEEWQPLLPSLPDTKPEPDAGQQPMTHSLNSFALQRLNYGAALAKASNKPILLSGGRVYGEPLSEAELFQQQLQLQGQSARWLETESRTTLENALESARMLKAEGITRIALVTHGWHQPRAISVFEQAGLTVTPAPMGFYSMPDTLFMQLLPKSYYLDISSRMLHEFLGLIWYRLSR